ncbi:M56 family metallopeptidase [Massilia pseudoviolaceinigra]|uniref:M56 family metallopeptidase n=1 Tax=Massilia pseudoviolaceinigra TaxID=3057165 RepID=UPI0027966057|nr:M56 family metallopeptidase [Massilia sp. CCM 9206]MDQ1922216.1 M56 family metallopeptidase [Massilia sp. CCM 9206]
MINSLPDLLLRLAIAASAAIVLLLLVRRPLRQRIDARLAYQAWLIVPLAMAAAALPPLFAAPVKALVLLPAFGRAGSATEALSAANPGVTGWLLLAWACGALATLALFCLSHRAFVRGLGTLTERGGLAYAAHAAGGPALLGLWRQKIVVPADFEQRYSAAEQALIIAHEQVHAQRGDAAANTLLALMQCAFWFNPLVHLAAPRFRFDQELACDALVMRRHPAQRRAYAGAMMKTQAGVSVTPSVCHWQSCHPLKERIMHLQQTSPTPSRRMAGRMLVAALAAVTVFGALAARAESTPGYAVAMTLRVGVDAAPQNVNILTPADFSVRSGAGESVWTGDFSITAVGTDQVFIRSKISQNGKLVSEPGMLTRLGTSSGIKIAGAEGKPGLALELTVTPAAQAVPGA